MINKRAGERPEWLKIRVPGDLDRLPVTRLINDLALNTVCQEARCPNIFECWAAGTATFMILGEVCTRRCTFCAVTKGAPLHADPGEPRRVAEAVAKMKVRHAVITTVNRDDLPDGGAEHFAKTIEEVQERSGASVEALISDLEGDREALRTILAARPRCSLTTSRRFRGSIRRCGRRRSTTVRSISSAGPPRSGTRGC